MKPNYETFSKLLDQITGDLRILAGEDTADSGVSWQDVAGTLACNMRVYANLLDKARHNSTCSFMAFPSIVEAIERTTI